MICSVYSSKYAATIYTVCLIYYKPDVSIAQALIHRFPPEQN